MEENIIYSNILTKCDTVVSSGGSGLTANEHFVPSENGEITFSYNAYNLADSFKVESEGIVYIDTGFVSNSGDINFCKPEGVTVITVTVQSSGSSYLWSYTLGCPESSCIPAPTATPTATPTETPTETPTATPTAAVPISPLSLANGFLSALRSDTVNDSEFPNAALANGFLSVLRVGDNIPASEFPNAALANGYLSTLHTDTI